MTIDGAPHSSGNTPSPGDLCPYVSGATVRVAADQRCPLFASPDGPVSPYGAPQLTARQTPADPQHPELDGDGARGEEEFGALRRTPHDVGAGLEGVYTTREEPRPPCIPCQRRCHD
ncbi:hypothetical protein OG607_44975 [Streptomyces sp. NBC_01537]|uniref:hypothetical protein n=1 Tax=Streptomyces sp. NBC_01537 TaxID=2903896 RepID=UPI003864D42F